jgi:hypothetical protein
MGDNYTGMKFWMSPVYHALQVHLNVDNNYFLAEPPCNIEKGAIGDEIKLAYYTNHTTRGDLLDKELNYTISEANGVYFPTQFTTWKRYSALKRQHISKFVSFLKRQIPVILRDYGQEQAIDTFSALKTIAFKFATIMAPSFSLDDIQLPPSILELKSKLASATTEEAGNVYEYKVAIPVPVEA